ncbi:MAG: M91 family zinc metallopeptidase [Egibacteraceae bacterium]
MNISARPKELHTFADVVNDIAKDLMQKSDSLGAALDAFRVTKGWHEFLAEVPPLDVDVFVTGDDAARLAKFVDGVATAFERADSQIGPDGIASADESQVQAPSLAPPAINLVQDGDRTILHTTEGDDHVRVTSFLGFTIVQTLDDRGNVILSQILTPEQARNLVIRTGSGNDVIEVDPNVQLSITVLGGRGNDEIGARTASRGIRIGGSGNDVIYGGDGLDQIDGGAGNDEIYGGEGHDYIDGQDGDDFLTGGAHDDAIYGGRGNDAIVGFDGLDYLEGGSGNDALSGGRGDDVLSGGRDDDTLEAGDGDDKLYGGRGNDRVDGGRGDNTAYAEGVESTVNARKVTVDLSGSPGDYAIRLGQPPWMSDEEFAVWSERIDSDLEFLRTSPTGRKGLEALDQASRDSDSGWNPFDEDNVVTILPTEALGKNGIPIPNAPAREPDRNWAWGPDGPTRVSIDPHANILYRRHRDMQGNASNWAADTPPSAIVYHELAHAHDYVREERPDGTFEEPDVDYDPDNDPQQVPNLERNSVGLDIDGDGDWDLLNDHPDYFTENALRDELGRERRDSYTDPPP